MRTDSRDIIRRLRKEGFELLRVSDSHHQFRHPTTKRRVTVQHPERDLPRKTIRSIYLQAGWDKD
jgi:predicted RNA binding protein YcfA (HicA-like mRNA interferase family)